MGGKECACACVHVRTHCAWVPFALAQAYYVWRGGKARLAGRFDCAVLIGTLLLRMQVADINSCGEGGLAGAITAALFLQEFVKDTCWLHIDTMGYTVSSSAGPGRPEGGEALAIRALYRFLLERYGART
jgi:Cytosol aminopeptidase family, catalytic domain